MQTYLKHTGMDILETLSRTTFEKGSAGYWRFTALRAQENWSSIMSDQQWILAGQCYNNTSTFIQPKFHANHDFPHDPIQRTPEALKRFCREFEETVRQWRIDMENGKGLPPAQYCY